MSAILDFADKLRTHVNIVDVVGRYVDLRSGGVNLKGLCPFHREKTPSFTVSPTKQIYHCFGCNEGGDAIKFVQKVERLEWIEAVRLLAQQHNLAMPEFRKGDGAGQSQQQDVKDRLLAVNDMAARFFAERLHAALSNDALEIAGYLKRRGIDADLANRFQLGLGPDAWQDLLENGKRKGFERESLVSAGLVIHNQNSNRYYDRFRKRLIFPIHDNLGRPIAFGGRVFISDAGPEEPKYVNSPETPLYHKGQALYALHLAKDTIAREGRALIMEGYMDVIRAHQHGFTNAVATCGTALTEEQARALKRLCKNVVFLYDGDAAGQKAMLRGAEILLEQGLNLTIVGLPDDHDPDSFLVAHGAEALSKLLDTSRSFLQFFLESAARQHDRRHPEGKVAIAEVVLPLLKRITQPIARTEYVRQTADFLELDVSLLLRQLSDANPQSLENLRKALNEQGGDAASPLERTLLRLAVESAAARERILQRVRAEWLRHDRIRHWFQVLAEAQGEELSWDYLLSQASEDEQEASFLRSLALSDEPVDASERTLDNVAARLHVNHTHLHNRLKTQALHEFFRQDYSAETPEVQNLTRAVDQAMKPLKTSGQSYFLKQPGRE